MVGSTVALWRYPVKSMMGEALNASELGERGLVGDRVYAVLDREGGKVASAKEPRKWAALFDLRAGFVERPLAGNGTPPVRITLPDGSTLQSDDHDVDDRLSGVLGRGVTLSKAVPPQPSLEEYWPDIEGLAHRETVTEEGMPEGTFFDLAPVHLLTTATLDELRRLYPEGRFEPRRFRPNIVLRPEDGAAGFVENDWVGKTIAIGGEVKLEITGLCPRCVMTTMEQDDLPKDPGILRAAAKHNGAHVGVYASVVKGGIIRRGDSVQVA